MFVLESFITYESLPTNTVATMPRSYGPCQAFPSAWPSSILHMKRLSILYCFLKLSTLVGIQENLIPSAKVMVLDSGKIHRVQNGCRYHALEEGACDLPKDEAKATRVRKIDKCSWMLILFVIFRD